MVNKADPMALAICMLNNIFLFASSSLRSYLEIVIDVVTLPYGILKRQNLSSQALQCAVLNVM